MKLIDLFMLGYRNAWALADAGGDVDVVPAHPPYAETDEHAVIAYARGWRQAVREVKRAAGRSVAS